MSIFFPGKHVVGGVIIDKIGLDGVRSVENGPSK